jgi:transcriptional regulator with XRE-family HTH domain
MIDRLNVKPVEAPTIGQLLRRDRIQSGMKNKDIAKGSGLSPQYISDIEVDRTVPSIDALKRYVGAAGRSLHIITGAPGDKPVLLNWREAAMVAALRDGDFATFSRMLAELAEHKGDPQ